MLIDLWSEETIQFALESSKTSKETREVYGTLQVTLDEILDLNRFAPEANMMQI